MSEETRERAHQIATQALGKPAGQRVQFLQDACANDADLRKQVDERIASIVLDGTVALEAKPIHYSPTNVPSLEVGTVTFGGRGELPGEFVGPYRILQLLGEGGFGSVYLAEQNEPVRRQVAVKILKAGVESKPVIARFEAERQALAMMDHPGIAQVYDAGTTGTGRPYFVMELVRGKSITSYCDERRLSMRARLELFVRVCHAVQHAHHKGVIHRDIKPSNVLVVERDGMPLPKVIDFGIAKAIHMRLTETPAVTEIRQLIGTPEYMSPEQAEGAGPNIDTRADVYSLGVVLYELLTGTTPFDGEQLRSAAYGEIQRIMREVDPQRPSTRLSALSAAPVGVGQTQLSDVEFANRRGAKPSQLARQVRGELDWIVMRAIEKDRNRRYESAASLAADVERFLRNEPVEARPPSVGYRVGKFVSRHRLVVASATLVALSLAGTFVGVSVGYLNASRERDAAVAARTREAQARAAAEKSKRYAAAADDFFLRRILGAAEPRVAGGREITVREVLDFAADRLDEVRDPSLRAAVLERLGTIDLSLGRREEAHERLTAALALRERFSGPDSEEAVRVRFCLAQVAAASGDAATARELFTGVLDRWQRAYGEGDPLTALAQAQLADTYVRLGEEKQAGELVNKSLAAYAAMGDAAPAEEYAVAMNLQASILEHAGDTAGAAAALEASLSHQKSAGVSPLIRAATLTNLGHVLGALERHDQAAQALSEALEIREQAMPAGDDAIAQTHAAIASAYLSAKQFDKATRSAALAVEMYRANHGDNHEYVATSLYALGAAQLGGGHADLAAQTLAGAVKAYDAAVGSKDWRAANARVKYGSALTRLGRYTDAEIHLLDAYRTLKESGQSPPAMASASQRLAELYEAWGKPKDAQEWRERAVAK
ncbi:MAG: serine/threonine protein kinase [Planctomycetes bacterium]|nr:serine/threonine protein kinase [Planctomycetota bacterium]